MSEQSQYCLIIHRTEKDELFQLPIGITTLGRESNRDLVLNHPMVSRLHAQIVCTPSACEITDMESANGTTINDLLLSPHTPYALKSQDCIHIGPFEIDMQIVPRETEIEPEIKTLEGMPAPAGVPVTSSMIGPSIEPSANPPENSSRDGEPYPQPPGEIPPSLPPSTGENPAEDRQISIAEGSSIYSTRLIHFLPDIYHNSSPDMFMERFLGLFELIWLPIEYNVDNFDLYLDPLTAPKEFLPWLGYWFDLSTDLNMTEAQVRVFLHEAYQIYSRRGTKNSLLRLLEIFTGFTPEIIEFGEDLAPHTFKVRFHTPKSAVNQRSIERIIEENKPAHTTYQLEFGH